MSVLQHCQNSCWTRTSYSPAMLNNLKHCGNKYWVLGVHLFCRWTFWNILITSQLVIMLPKGGWCTCLLQWSKCWVFMGSAMSLRIWSSIPRTCSPWQCSPPRGTPSLQATSSWKQASNSEGKVPYPFLDWGQYQEDTCLKLHHWLLCHLLKSLCSFFKQPC